MLKHNVGLIHNLSWLHVHREYSRLEARDSTIPPLKTWLRCRCAALADETDNERAELYSLSVGPSKRACSFKSMTSFGSHYRVDLEEADTQHITFDSGVAELGSRRGGPNTADNCAVVDLIRVGILKDILVVNYGKFPIVLMAVSWLAKHTTHQPRMQRDAYGFWLANMAAIPRDVSEPYILPGLASQVRRMLEDVLFMIDVSFQTTIGIVHHRQLHNMYVQVFFVNDKSMPGWCVVVKKEARGRRIHSTEVEHILGQEESSGDRHAFQEMEDRRGHTRDESSSGQSTEQQRTARRRIQYELVP